MAGQKLELETEAAAVRRELQELEEDLSKADSEKAKKDHTIRGLNDEITSQEDTIQKLNKEKKFFQVSIYLFFFFLVLSNHKID